MDYTNLKIPPHVAIILDGNGRWAKARGLTRSEGHKAGAKNFKKLSLYILSKGIKVLSIYAFSTENFKRSREEVDYLMNLFLLNFKKEIKTYNRENIKIIFSGRRKPLSDEVWNSMKKIEASTGHNTRAVINICLNYGGHAELIDATKKIVGEIEEGKLALESLDEKIYEQYLYQDLPPVDLLIRTGGEIRLSNFLLWQSSYAELYFTKTYFPDFQETAFDEAIAEYTRRDRRFGGIPNENQNH